MIGFLGLGSNVGDRRAHLQAAVDLLPRQGVRVLASSSVYETEPVGAVPVCVTSGETTVGVCACAGAANARPASAMTSPDARRVSCGVPKRFSPLLHSHVIFDVMRAKS